MICVEMVLLQSVTGLPTKTCKMVLTSRVVRRDVRADLGVELGVTVLHEYIYALKEIDCHSSPRCTLTLLILGSELTPCGARL